MNTQTKEIEFDKLTDTQKQYLLYMKVYGCEIGVSTSLNTRMALARRGLVVGGGYFCYNPRLSSLGIVITPDPGVEWLDVQKQENIKYLKRYKIDKKNAIRNIEEAERKLVLLLARIEAKQS